MTFLQPTKIKVNMICWEGQRIKLEQQKQVNAALGACKALKLDNLVIIGGVTSNTDVAQLAEIFAEAKCPTKVVVASKLTLFDLTKQLCDAVQARAEQDKYHGVILLPKGLIESIPEVYALLPGIHGLLRRGVSVDNVSSQLSPWASTLFEFLPPFIRKPFLLHPESDDSAQLSQIETEKLLAHLVEEEMNKRLKEDLLGSSGKLKEAKRFIYNMPIKPDALVWATLLAPCKVHGDVELRLTAKKVIELESCDVGAYVSFSNISADVGSRISVYIMMKYATIARGDVENLMKFARDGCREKIENHATGIVIIQEADKINSNTGVCGAIVLSKLFYDITPLVFDPGGFGILAVHEDISASFQNRKAHIRLSHTFEFQEVNLEDKVYF